MKCHNIFTLDENRDEPTFTNDKQKDNTSMACRIF